MTVEEILQQYPRLRPADIHDALAYAYDHPEEMEADLAADDEQLVQEHSGCPCSGLFRAALAIWGPCSGRGSSAQTR